MNELNGLDRKCQAETSGLLASVVVSEDPKKNLTGLDLYELVWTGSVFILKINFRFWIWYDQVWTNSKEIQFATIESEIFVWIIAAATLSSHSSGAPPAVTSITISETAITNAPKIQAWNINKLSSLFRTLVTRVWFTLLTLHPTHAQI
jgi:hypothetical protein